MIDYFRENISWLKDFFTLVFVGTGTVVAILTYRRARATILQPIRTEVIKKQSEILSSLLHLLKENRQSFETGLDYVNLVQINTLLTLENFGFVFKEHKELSEKLQDGISGWMPCGKTNKLKDVEIIGVFSEEKENTNECGKEKYNNLKNGKIDIDKIYLTKKHSAFLETIFEFRNNPFMPSLIQQILIELSNDISNNLTIILKGELEVFMLNFSREYFKNGHAPMFNTIGVYNSFNHSRIHHRQTIEKLRYEIRKHLRIDDVW